MREKGKRFDNIDLLKFGSIFCVLIIHGFYLKIDFWNDESITSYIHYFFRTILSTSVPLFFFCNGFLLFGKGLDLKRHIVKTIHYVVVTYIWAFLTMIVLMPIKDEFLSLREIIWGVREWKLGWINHLWFMGTLVCIYVIFPVLKSAVDSNKNILAYFTIVVGILTIGNKALGMLATVVCGRYMTPQFFDMFNPFAGAYDWAYAYFGLGGLVHIYYEKIKTWYETHHKKCTLAGCGIILISSVGLFLYGVYTSKLINGHWDVVWNGYDTIFTACSVCALFLLSMNYKVTKENLVTKAIGIVGNNTLGIYFIHEIFTYLTLDFMKSKEMFGNYFVQIIYGLFILLISTVATLMLKKIPVISRLVK